jgi:hypothetical protein
MLDRAEGMMIDETDPEARPKPVPASLYVEVGARAAGRLLMYLLGLGVVLFVGFGLIGLLLLGIRQIF